MTPRTRAVSIVSIVQLILACATTQAAPLEQATTRPAALDRAINSSAAGLPAQYQRKFNTLAHQMLDLEGEVDVVPEAKYKVLDTILADAKSRVVYDETEKALDKRRAQMLAAFATIDEVLTDHNVIYPPGDWILTLAEGLTPHTLTPEIAKQALARAYTERRRKHINAHIGEEFYYMDCDLLSFMYMAVGEIVGFKLNLVEVPRHNYVRYHLDAKDYIAWETTLPARIPDDRDRYSSLPAPAVRDRVFLASMTADETLGYFYSCRGARCQKLSPPNLKQAAKDFERSVELYPQAPAARNELAWMCVSIPGFRPVSAEDALGLALRALSVQPRHDSYLDTLAAAYAEVGDFEKAVSYQEEAIRRFDPIDPDSDDVLKRYRSRLDMYLRKETYNKNGGDPANKPPPTDPSTRPRP